MKNLNEMTDEQLALAYIEGSNEAYCCCAISQSSSRTFSLLYVTGMPPMTCSRRHS